MVSKTLTISLPEHLLEFLEENKSLSPSKVMQGALINIQDSIKNNPQLMEANKEVEKWKRTTEKYRLELQAATNFITDNQLWEKYVKERGMGAQ